MHVTDPENSLDYVKCDNDFMLRILMAVGVGDGHLVEYRANGAGRTVLTTPIFIRMEKQSRYWEASDCIWMIWILRAGTPVQMATV